VAEMQLAKLAKPGNTIFWLVILKFTKLEMEPKGAKGNYTDYVWTKFLKEGVCIPKFQEETMWYMTYQIERSPTTGQLHYQGFTQFREKVTLTQAKMLMAMGKELHLEVRRGTCIEAMTYCQKKDSRFSTSYFESGFFLNRMRGLNPRHYYYGQMIAQGYDNLDLIADPNCSEIAHSKIPLQFVYTEVPYDGQRHCIVIWGPGGSGKSQLAKSVARVMEENLDMEVYTKDDDKWWPEYKAQEIVIINEFDGMMSYTAFKRLIDKSALKLEVKGAHVMSNIKYVIICSNKCPDMWYKTAVDHTGELKPAFRRRVQNSYYLGEMSHQKAVGDAILAKVKDMERSNELTSPTTALADSLKW